MFVLIFFQIVAAIDVIVYATVTGLWWISSLTVLLPFLILLNFSLRAREIFFSFFLSRLVFPLSKRTVVPLRKRTFDLLKQQLPKRDSALPLRVLEIGIGAAENLRFYPENSRLIALDRNPFFEKYFEENREKYPSVHLEKMILGMAEDMQELKDSSVDIVVSTYVFCSVSDPEAVIREVKRVLKPDGKFLYLEHVAFPNDRWGLKIQNWVTPLWIRYFAGCHPNRNTIALIKSAGFSDVIINYFEIFYLIIWVRPQIYGIATK